MKFSSNNGVNKHDAYAGADKHTAKHEWRQPSTGMMLCVKVSTYTLACYVLHLLQLEETELFVVLKIPHYDYPRFPEMLWRKVL